MQCQGLAGARPPCDIGGAVGEAAAPAVAGAGLGDAACWRGRGAAAAPSPAVAPHAHETAAVAWPVVMSSGV